MVKTMEGCMSQDHPSCSIRQGIENSLMELSLAERGFVRCSWCRATPDRCDHCQSWFDDAEREFNRLSSLLTTYDKIERGLLAVPRRGTNGGLS